MELNLAWFIFYGHKFNMSREETIITDYSEMMDMLICYAIEQGTARQKIRKKHMTYDEAISLK